MFSYYPLSISKKISSNSSIPAVISGCILFNVLILTADKINTMEMVIFLVGLVTIIYLQKWTIKTGVAVMLITIVSTLLNTHTRTHAKNIIWNQIMSSNKDYYDMEKMMKLNTAIWEDKDHSIKDGYAILTNETQRIIHHNQQRCHNGTSIYQVQNYAHGMGSELHFHANILALAIEKQALFAWGDGACTKYDAHCRDLYENEHTCTQEQLRHMHVVNITEWVEDMKIPKMFISKLPGSFTMAQMEYWWRTQAMGYLMRFNSDTRRRIKIMRSELHGQHMSLNGAINVNIRSGDKIAESRLSPTENFIDAAEELIRRQPSSYSRTLFITSDNLQEILKAKEYARKKNLQVIYSDVPRMENGHHTDRVNSFWKYDVTISVLMQLSMTAECDAWIGSRSSNWNRIIDIYRCTRTQKCKQIFIEVGDTAPGHYEHRPMGGLWTW
jgi:hypothetical protein